MKILVDMYLTFSGSAILATSDLLSIVYEKILYILTLVFKNNVIQYEL